MPALENVRWERFAQELAKGTSALAAYEIAGFKSGKQNSARLREREVIKARLAELQAPAVKKTLITIDTLTAELEEARLLAIKLGQSSAAVSAAMGKAKLLGFLIERVETGAPGEFEELTIEQQRQRADAFFVSLGITDGRRARRGDPSTSH